MHSSVHAAVRILQRSGVAASTSATVIEILSATSPAYAAPIAVKLVLRHIVVEEVAFRAEVFAETCSAVRTVLLHILFFVAERADNQLDVVTGKHVAVVDADLQRVLGFVVAVPATKYLAAARRPYLASPPVVHAPVLLWSGVTVHRSRLSSLLLLCSFLIPD